ncbi:pyridoxal phosphate-dependent transferase [Xylariaceae sp. FL1019]|nr:pyridoxal phosphate-dependent transferase [Xylariaceae sp. FL1019]
MFSASDKTEAYDASLNHDFHNAWGSVYTSRSTVDDEHILPLWQQYAVDKGAVDRRYKVLLDEYTELFQKTFGGYYSISLHAHATDSLMPTTIASLILNTAATSNLVLDSPILKPKPYEKPEDTGMRVRSFALDFLGWDETHVITPNFIVSHNCYGAGYGPLAHASKEWETNAIASGPKPVIINLKDLSAEDMNAQFAAAKATGCIAVMFDMISTEDGEVLPPTTFGIIKECCSRNRLLLVIDETMAALRCGAPFSFQRPEYAEEGVEFQPDLVVFGKGIGVSGIAINFNGIMTKGLMYTEKEDIYQTIRYWRAMVSRPVRLPILLEAISILRAAEAEHWTENSERIGQTIRQILYELEPEMQGKDMVRSLGSVIVIHRELAIKYRLMCAIRRRSPWARLLPRLSSSSADRDALMK